MSNCFVKKSILSDLYFLWLIYLLYLIVRQISESHKTLRLCLWLCVSVFRWQDIALNSFLSVLPSLNHSAAAGLGHLGAPCSYCAPAEWSEGWEAKWARERNLFPQLFTLTSVCRSSCALSPSVSLKVLSVRMRSALPRNLTDWMKWSLAHI